MLCISLTQSGPPASSLQTALSQPPRLPAKPSGLVDGSPSEVITHRQYTPSVVLTLAPFSDQPTAPVLGSHSTASRSPVFQWGDVLACPLRSQAQRMCAGLEPYPSTQLKSRPIQTSLGFSSPAHQASILTQGSLLPFPYLS